MLKFTTLLFITLFSLSSYANDQLYVQHNGRILKRIVISGNSKTSDKVIIRELDVKQGQKMTTVDIKESYLRLFNLRIFSEVEFDLNEVGPNESELKIRVKERWTLIPIAKLTGGGGTTQYTLGAYDINVAGEYLELGAQYENLNGASGFVHWFRNPRLFGTRIRSGYDIWNTTRNRLIFNSDVEDGETADEVAAYTVTRQRYNFFLAKEFVYWFIWGVGVDHTRMITSDDGLDNEFIAKNAQAGFEIPDELSEYAAYTNFRLGRLNFTNYLVEGFQSDIEFRYADAGVGGNESSYRITQNTRAFFLLPHEQNIGLNFRTGHSNSKNFQNNFFVGGFENVRGFQDGQFFDKHFWQSNAEYRVTSYKQKWFVVQNNFFYDIGNVGEDADQLFFGSNEEPFQSVGAGVRIISPEIFRFNLRIDVAQGLNYNRALDISFGLQQFF